MPESEVGEIVLPTWLVASVLGMLENYQGMMKLALGVPSAEVRRVDDEVRSRYYQQSLTPNKRRVDPDAATMRRVLERLAHEKMRSIIQSSESMKVLRYNSPLDISDSREWALLTYLEQNAERLEKERNDIWERLNLPDSKFVVICPELDLPLPAKPLHKIRWHGMRLQLGKMTDTYRVEVEKVVT